jgi:hypothetical protein
MCKHCDVDKLNLDNFDSFFQGACTQGFKSMICKHCSRTFITEFVFFAGQMPDSKNNLSIKPAEEPNCIRLY